jgi:hypothetical protein
LIKSWFEVINDDDEEKTFLDFPPAAAYWYNERANLMYLGAFTAALFQPKISVIEEYNSKVMAPIKGLTVRI